MARPRKSEQESRSARLPGIPVTVADKIDLQAKADAAGLSLSEFCRRQIFEGEVVVRTVQDADPQLITAINRAGGLLMQTVRSLNFGQGYDPHDLDRSLHLLRSALESVAKRYGS